MSIADHLARLHASPVIAPGVFADVRRAAYECVDLLEVPEPAWRDLAARSADANAFYGPGWAMALARHASGYAGARALLAWDGPMRRQLIGMLPVVSAWRAFKLPLPVFVAWQPYAPLTTPLIARDALDEGARGLIAAADKAGALGVLLTSVQEDSRSLDALRRAAKPAGDAWSFNRHRRAMLDARQTAEAAVEAAGTRKFKELRRQRHRLEERGALRFELTADAAALEDFLALEASGWKGANGTALMQAGHAAFVRQAFDTMRASGHAKIASLVQNEKMVAAGIVVRQGSRAFFFKIAHDESAAKFSPGAQLTLELTRAICADPAIDDVDSLAVAGHPMIDGLWRSRLAMSDVLLPVRRDAAAMVAIKAAFAARRTLRDATKRLLR